MNPVQTQMKKVMEEKRILSVRELFGRIFSWAAILCAALTLIALIPLGKTLFASWLQWRRIRALYGPAYLAYGQVLKDLRRLRVEIAPSTTPTEVAALVREYAASPACPAAAAELPALVERFVALYHIVFFGQGEGMEELLKLQRSIHALCRVRPRKSAPPGKSEPRKAAVASKPATPRQPIKSSRQR
jgi:hypothetical protein